MATTITAGNATNGLAFSADNTGILEIKTGTGAGTTAVSIDTSQNFKFNSGYGSAATAYGCRAWVNFNGTGTVAIRASGNVSSITDNGVGLYAINFTTAMSDANYSTIFCAGNTTSNQTTLLSPYSTAPTISSCQVAVLNGGQTTFYDPSYVFASIFR